MGPKNTFSISRDRYSLAVGVQLPLVAIVRPINWNDIDSRRCWENCATREYRLFSKIEGRII